MDLTDELIKYYSGYDEDGRLASRHGAVEFITTMHYIEKYLKPGMRIIEIGAGTGRYSHALSQMGYQVDAVELVEHNIDIFRKNIQPGEDITVTQGNALDLGRFKDETYDMTLLLGPMYHLYTNDDKRQALVEALRITKKGGIVFAAYCMGDASLLSYGFAKGMLDDLMESCQIDVSLFDGFKKPWGLFELYRKEDIDALREEFNVSQLHFVSADGYTNHMREIVDGMDDDTYKLFIKYHLSVCERADMVGLSHHTLDVFRKNP